MGLKEYTVIAGTQQLHPMETDALLNAGFISESEFSIIQWSLKNRDILESPNTQAQGANKLDL